MKLFYTLLFSTFTLLVSAQDTFSIIAVDTATGEVGSAGASCLDNISFPGSGGAIIISDIIPGKGAIHTQSYWNATNQQNAHAKMLEGLSPEDLILWLRQNDVEGVFGQFKRQYGIVDFDDQGQPRSASFTGSSCFDWKGHLNGINYAIQGNILLGPQIIDSIEAHFLATEGQPLADRLMYALQGANVVGADSRCTNNGTSSLSAFVRVAKPSDHPDSMYLDLNVPSLPTGMEPIDSLQTLFDAWKAATSSSKEQLQSRPEIVLFPNPSTESKCVVIWPYPTSGRLVCYTTNGAKQYESNVISGKNNISMPVTAGVYLLQFYLENTVVGTKKWVVLPVEK